MDGATSLIFSVSVNEMDPSYLSIFFLRGLFKEKCFELSRATRKKRHRVFSKGYCFCLSLCVLMLPRFVLSSCYFSLLFLFVFSSLGVFFVMCR